MKGSDGKPFVSVEAPHTMNNMFLKLFPFYVLVSISAMADGTNSLNVAFRYGGYETTKRLPVYTSSVKQDNSDAVNLYFQRSHDLSCSFALLEKAFFEKDFSSFTNETQQLKVMNAEISADSQDGSLVVAVKFASLIVGLERMIESRLPQIEWLDNGFFSAVFPVELMERDKSGKLMNFKTYSVLLELGCEIAHYKRTQGTLPEKLNDISDLSARLLRDAWGKPVLYMQKDGKWLLKSLGENQQDDGYDFNVNVPVVPNGKDLVIYEGMSENRRKLLHDGVLRLGPIVIELDRQTGSVKTSYPDL